MTNVVAAWETEPDPEEKCCVSIEVTFWHFAVPAMNYIKCLMFEGMAWCMGFVSGRSKEAGRSSNVAPVLSQDFVWYNQQERLRDYQQARTKVRNSFKFTKSLRSKSFDINGEVILMYACFQIILHCISWRWNPRRREDSWDYRWILRSHDIKWGREARLPYLQTLISQLSAWKTTQWTRTIYIWIYSPQGEIFKRNSYKLFNIQQIHSSSSLILFRQTFLR